MRIRILAGLSLTAAALAAPGQTVSGASLTVDTTVDAVDANPGDGVCADVTGACTLRAAIMETNALPGADSIALDFATYTLSIPGAGEDGSATGDLDITDDLTIAGGVVVNDAAEPGSVIDGGGLDRVLHIFGEVGVDISGVIVRHGDVIPAFSSVGGILNSSGTVALTDSVVRDNKASSVGGIGNNGTMTLTNVTVADNLAAVIGGVSNGGFGRPTVLTIDHSRVTGNLGGGIFNGSDGSLTILDSLIDGNTREGFGGAVSNNGQLTIVDTSITGNSSGGGAIEHRLGTATLTNVTISGNVAKSAGGAIFNDGGGQMTLVNSTLSGNSALSEPGPFGRVPGRGGAIYILSGNVTLRSATVSGNAADDEGGAIFNPGSSDLFSDPVVALQTTIVAGNTAGEPVKSCSGTVVSEGHNLEDADTCGFSAAGDLTNADAKLGALENNGGPTETHALMPGSPAIDAGDNPSCPATDQRGVTRPIDGDNDVIAVCDIGAYEAEAGLAATPPATASPTPGETAPAGPALLPRTGSEGRANAGSYLPIALGLSLVVGITVGGLIASKGDRPS